MINSGDCESKGMRRVTTKNECEDAAVFLNLRDTSAYDTSTSELDRPQGCVYSSLNFLSWNSPENPPVSTCGSVHKGVTRSCVCSKPGKGYYISAISDALNLRNNASKYKIKFSIFFSSNKFFRR